MPEVGDLTARKEPPKAGLITGAVSYTHLDVYKRQPWGWKNCVYTGAGSRAWHYGTGEQSDLYHFAEL